MKKRMVSFFTSLLMIFSLAAVVPTMDASALQNRSANFVKSYTLTGVGATDMINIAKAQIGRNGAAFGYTEEWCADFVSDCARLAGQSIAIPPNASCYNMMTAIDKAGGDYISASSARPGDLLFYSTSNYPNGGAHVEIVYANNNGVLSTIGGNSGNANNSLSMVKDHKNQNGQPTVYKAMRPNYKSATPPTNVKLSKNQNWYDIKDTIELTPSSKGGTSYYMSVTKDGKQIINGISLNGTYKFAANKYGYGDYHAWITACNSAGSTDSNGIDFSVVGKAGYSDVWTSKPIYELGDTVSISVSTVCAKGQVIGIDKEGTGRVITETCGLTYTISAQKLGVGKYSAYFSVYNGSGGIDTKRVEFVIAKPSDLGVSFYARIKNIKANKYLTVSDSNVLGKTIDCSKNQVWKFSKQSDGSYKIISTVDNKALDVDNFGEAGGGTNVHVYNSWDSTAQKYYLFNAFGAYYIKPICCDMFIDMSLSDYNVEVWGGGVNWDPQKFAIEKVNLSDIGVHKYGSWTTTKAATCTADGAKTRKCSVCGKTETASIAKTAHKYSTEWTIDKAASCTAEGSKSHHCTVCGAKNDVTSIAKTAHKYDTGKITTSATCTADGVKTYTCSVCKGTKTEAIAKTGHTAVNDNAVAATCTTAGKTEGSHCSKCKAVIKAQTDVPAKGHTYGSWTTTKAATCTAAGSQTRKCSVCGNAETKAIAKLSHTPSGWITVKAPSVGVSGLMQKKCTVCGTQLETMEIPAIEAKKLSACKITLSSSSAYFRGTRVKPTVTVKDGDTVLRSGTDYTVAYYNNLSVGTASVKISGKGNYAGTVTKTYTIKARNIANCDIELAQSKYYFTGARVRPAVKSVKIGDTELYSGNYKVISYTDNLSTGTAKIVIQGRNNLTGTVTKTFKINPRSVATCDVKLTKNPSNKYKPTVTVSYFERAIYNGNYTVSYVTSADKKTVKVTLTGKNNLTGKVTKTYTVR